VDSETLRTNERLKNASGLVGNLGAALLAAAAARWFALGFDGHALVWLIASGMIMWSGNHVLTLLEAEPADG
jgi:hypothetical protein